MSNLRRRFVIAPSLRSMWHDNAVIGDRMDRKDLFYSPFKTLALDNDGDVWAKDFDNHWVLTDSKLNTSDSRSKQSILYMIETSSIDVYQEVSEYFKSREGFVGSHIEPIGKLEDYTTSVLQYAPLYYAGVAP